MVLLTIAGEAGGPMEWGRPAFVCLKSRVIAVAEVAKSDVAGQHLHIEHFRPLGISVEHAIAVRRLALLEIISLAVTTNTSLCGITLSLHYRASHDDDGVAVAAARAAFLRSFGAIEIQVVPDIAHTRAGQFVVEAVWKPNSRALEMLDERLALERGSYHQFVTRQPWARQIRKFLRFKEKLCP